MVSGIMVPSCAIDLRALAQSGQQLVFTYQQANASLRGEYVFMPQARPHLAIAFTMKRDIFNELGDFCVKLMAPTGPGCLLRLAT